MRSYAWKQSLKRHIDQNHFDTLSVPDDESDTNMSDDSSNGQQSDSDDHNSDNSSNDSGYESIDGITVAVDENDDRQTDGDSEAVWLNIVEDIVKEIDSRYQEKPQHVEDSDKSELVEETMRSMYKRALKKFIINHLVLDSQLQLSEYYTKLNKDLNKFSRKHPLSRAVRATLRKNDDILDEILDDFDDSTRYSLNSDIEDELNVAE